MTPRDEVMQGQAAVDLAEADRQRFLQAVHWRSAGAPFSLSAAYLGRALFPEVSRIGEARGVLPVLSSQAMAVDGPRPDGPVCVAWRAAYDDDELSFDVRLADAHGAPWMHGTLRFRLVSRGDARQ